MATQKRQAKSETTSGAEQIAAVLAGMESGNSLRQACQAVGVAPSSFIRWVEADAHLAEQYARARERLLDMKAEELEDIGEKAARAESAVEVAGLRLLSDNRKWLLSKLAPKKYGDRVTNEHTGPDGKDLNLTVNFVKP